MLCQAPFPCSVVLLSDVPVGFATHGREKNGSEGQLQRGQIIRQPSAARNRILLRLTPAGLGPQGLLSHVEGGEAFCLAPAPPSFIPSWSSRRGCVRLGQLPRMDRMDQETRRREGNRDLSRSVTRLISAVQPPIVS